VCVAGGAGVADANWLRDLWGVEGEADFETKFLCERRFLCLGAVSFGERGAGGGDGGDRAA